MTQNLPNWFTKKYDQSSVQHIAQQRERRLGGTVSMIGSFVGDTVYFPRMGKVEMYDSPRMARIALANADMDMISLQAKPKFILMGVWDPDKKKLSVDTAAEYGRAQATAYVRAEDRIIRDVLASAAAVGVGNTAGTFVPITTIGDYTTVADLDTVAQGIAVLGGQEMWEGQEVTYVSPFILKANMALDPYMAKTDVKGNLPWNELNWRTYEELPKNGDGTGVDTFLYARSAIGYGFNDDLTKIEGREDAALTDLIGNWFQAGAMAREPAGIVRIKSKIPTALARKPVPIIDMAA